MISLRKRIEAVVVNAESRMKYLSETGTRYVMSEADTLKLIVSELRYELDEVEVEDNDNDWQVTWNFKSMDAGCEFVLNWIDSCDNIVYNGITTNNINGDRTISYERYGVMRTVTIRGMK